MSVAVSVVIPTYGHRAFVRATIESVFAQSLTDFELIVVNDGSPDDTADVLRPLIDAGRIRYLDQPNMGQGAARNRGLAAAKGRYVAYLDDDDLWPPDKLAWQKEALDANPDAVLVYGSHSRLLPNGRLIPDGKSGFPSGDVHDAFRLRNWIHSLGQTLIRRDALQAVNGFDPAIWGADDWDLFIRLARIGRFLHIDRTALHYRIHAANASRHAVRHARNDLKVMRKHCGWNLPMMARHIHLAGRYFAPNLLDSADVAAAAGDRHHARVASLYALMFKPTLLARPGSAARVARAFMGRTVTRVAPDPAG